MSNNIWFDPTVSNVNSQACAPVATTVAVGTAGHYGWSRSPAPARLNDDDVERIARRVADLLRPAQARATGDTIRELDIMTMKWSDGR